MMLWGFRYYDQIACTKKLGVIQARTNKEAWDGVKFWVDEVGFPQTIDPKEIMLLEEMESGQIIY